MMKVLPGREDIMMEEMPENVIKPKRSRKSIEEERERV